MNKLIGIAALVIIGLIGLNVYQYQNPNVVEVPVGQEQIDTTSWVRKNAVISQRAIIDSLKTHSKAMAQKVKEQQDQIANYTTITGRLKTEVDSLQSEKPDWNAIPFVDRMLRRDSVAIMDTTFRKSKTFGDDLFVVDGYVDVRITSRHYPDSTAPFLQVRQDFDLNQIRDLKIGVTTTVSDNKNRILTYVTSPDFKNLEYKSYTQYEPTTEWPWFWIGVGTGAAGVLAIAIAL